MARKYTRILAPERPCANPACGKVFQPERAWQIYCCRRCLSWVHNRAYEAKHNDRVEKLALELEDMARYAREQLMIARTKPMTAKGRGKG